MPLGRMALMILLKNESIEILFVQLHQVSCGDILLVR